MIFSRKPKSAGTSEPRRPSLLGSLLIPEVGATLTPLKETTSIFMKLIAMVFAMNGLFPKDHPALMNVPGATLNLSQIFSTAHKGLSYTREGAPKVALFYAVAGTLVFSGLTILTIFLLMFTGKAHAQTSNFFTSPSTTDDIGYNWLEFLFKGTIPATMADPSYLGQAATVQAALVTALGFYSNAILVFAAFILFYHLVSMIVETAHHGTPMGKRANQIWAPIRLVVAVGLLVPVSSTGLNCGQYIAVQMAEWGSGLASNVWSKFVGSLANSPVVPPPVPYNRSIAENIALQAACTLFQNYDISGSVTGSTLTQAGMSNDYAVQNVPLANLASGDVGGEWRTEVAKDKNTCGQYVFHQVTFDANDTAATAAASAMFTAEQTAYTEAMQTATNDIKNNLLTASPPYIVGDHPPSWQTLVQNGQWTDIIGDVQTTYTTDLAKAEQTASQGALATDVSTWTDTGWLAAGAYFNNIAKTQGDVETAITPSISVSPPIFSNIAGQGRVWPRVEQEIYDFKSYLEEASKSGAALPTPPTASPTTNTLCTQTVRQYASQMVNSGIGDLKSALTNVPGAIASAANKIGNVEEQIADSKIGNLVDPKIGDPVGQIGLIDILAQIADSAASMNCVWQPAPSATATQQLASTGSTSFLGILFTTNNPYVSLIRLGHANLNTAYFLMNLIFATSILPFTNFMAGLIGFIATVFFTCGFTLAYFLPLVPFMTFLLNGVTWVIMVLESVIMMPLVALAHLNPEGDGLPGQNARNAYFFLFSILLRPVLMIFGLIAAWLISFTGLVLMNKLYMLTVSGAQTIGGGAHVFVSRLVFSLMYVVIVYIICHKSFHLIGSLPNHAMSWIGASDAPKESMGSAADNLGGTISAVSGYAGQQLFSQVGAAGQGIVGAMTPTANDGAVVRGIKKTAYTGLVTGGLGLAAAGFLGVDKKDAAGLLKKVADQGAGGGGTGGGASPPSTTDNTGS